MSWLEEAQGIEDTISTSEPLAVTIQQFKKAYNHFTKKTSIIQLASYEKNGLIFNYNADELQFDYILPEDVKLIISAIDLPDLTQIGIENLEFTFNNKTWLAEKIQPLVPGGILLLYTIQCRIKSG